MPTLKHRDFTGGMTPDIFPHKMALNQCTQLFNYRNWKSAASKVGGQAIEIETMPQSMPTMLKFWRTPFSNDVGFWMTAKAGTVYKVAPSGQASNVTGSPNPYVNVFDNTTLSDTTIWTSTQMFGGLTFVCSNEFVTPQFLTTNAQVSPSGLLQDLPGWVWNTPGATNPYTARTAKVVRAFDNQLWAANIVNKKQDGTLEYLPNVILYSDKATNPANTRGNYIPDTWQPSSGTSGTASNWAGYVSLNTTDPIIDLVPLRDTLLAFTTNQCFIIPKLQFTQQALVPQELANVRGLLSNDCAVVFDGRVLFITTDDIMIMTGSSIDFQSQANQRIKDTFFNQYLNLNPAYQQNVFARYNRFYNEVWIFYPSRQSNDGSCDMALIWDVESQGWSQVEVPPLYDCEYAPTIGNNSTLPWTGYNYAFARLHYQSDLRLLAQDVGYTRVWTGSTPAYQTIFEKVYDLEEQGGEPTNIKNLKAIFPFIQGDIVATFQFKFSNQPFSTGIDWTESDYSGDFTTIQDYKIDPQRYGRYMAMRVLTNDNREHNITSIDLEITGAGRRG